MERLIEEKWHPLKPKDFQKRVNGKLIKRGLSEKEFISLNEAICYSSLHYTIDMVVDDIVDTFHIENIKRKIRKNA